MILLPGRSASWSAGGGTTFADVVSALSGSTDAGAWDYTQDVYQSSGGSAAGNGDLVGSWLDGINGYDFAEATNPRKPTLTSDGISFNGSDERLICTGFTMSGLTNHVVMMRLETSDTEGVIFSDSGSSNYVGAFEDGSSSTALTQNFGSMTITVDGSSAGSTRDSLHAALSTGSPVVFRGTGMDASAQSGFRMCNFPSPDTFSIAGVVSRFLICSDSDYTSNQSTIDGWMGL